MTTHKITKTKFSQIKDKRFYFPNGILSLPFGHLSLNELDEYKKNKGQRIEKYFWTEKEKLLENKALQNCPRLDFLNNILLQVPKIVNIDCTKFDRNTTFLDKEQQTILDYILSAGWKENRTESTHTTEIFQGNILVVGRTGSGKTTFIQKLGKNSLFGDKITDVFWVSKIVLTAERENFISDSFEEQEVHFSYRHDLDDLNYLVGNFMQDKSEYIDSELGEKLAVTRLIIMDDDSDLGDKSEEFCNFLTGSRKYGFSCLYVFHTIYPGRQSWEMIKSQTHIFNFFPWSIHSSRILKTLSLFASRQKNTYLPNQQAWRNKLFFQISNSTEKKCLIRDTRGVNELGPEKLRTSADDGEEQTCYFNKKTKVTHILHPLLLNGYRMTLHQ